MRSSGRLASIVAACCLVLAGAPAAHASAACDRVGATPYDRPALDQSGGTIAYATSAALVPVDDNRTLDVYVQALPEGEPVLVSVALGGGSGDGRSGAPAISADGRYVAFESAATDLVAGDDPAGITDIFVRDLVAQTTALISAAPGDAPRAGASTRPAISPDGTLVAFESFAPNLVEGDTNLITDVFVYDRASGTTERVSVATDGSQADGLGSFAPSVSDTGIVAFHSTATAWVTPGSDVRSFLRDGIYYARNVYVRDLAASTTTHVSVTADGSPPDGLSLFPSVSADGTKVAFLSSATNLVPGDTNNRPDVKGFSQSDVFLRDLTAGTTTRLSVADDGSEADGLGSSGSSISLDGSRVVFESAGTNLDDGDTNGALDVFVRDVDANATHRVSTDAAGLDAGAPGALGFGSVSGSISGDGDTLAFVSSAPGLVGPVGDVFGVFLRAGDDLTGPLGIGCRSSSSQAAAHDARRRHGDLRPGGKRPADPSRVRNVSTVATAGGSTDDGIPIVWFAGVPLIALVMVRRRIALLTAVALLLVVTPASAHHHAAIQPGAPMLRDTGSGTGSLNFVFRDRTTQELYVGTAAHVVRELSVGQRAANDEAGEFGTLVYTREGVFSFSTQDFALIKIDPDRYEDVSAAVRHWGGPSGVAAFDELVPGLPTYQYGQGSFFRTSEPTRLKTGVITAPSADNWGYIGWVSEARAGFGGDSGSPILAGPDGRALAITILFASVLYGDPGVQIGPTVDLIMHELRNAGFDLELVTAPFHGPAGDVGAMAEHCVNRPIEGETLNDGCAKPGSDVESFLP